MYAYSLNDPVNRFDPGGNCSKFLGFLWKVDCKQSSCPKSKKYIKPKEVNPIGTYNKGKGNVYIVTTDQLKTVDEWEKNAVVIVDKRTSSNPTMQVQNSYKITKTKHQKEILNLMIEYNDSNPVDPTWDRTIDSMLIEWDAHNDGYKGRFFIGLLKENAAERLRHVDFDNASESLKYWDYLGK